MGPPTALGFRHMEPCQLRLDPNDMIFQGWSLLKNPFRPQNHPHGGQSLWNFYNEFKYLWTCIDLCIRISTRFPPASRAEDEMEIHFTLTPAKISASNILGLSLAPYRRKKYILIHQIISFWSMMLHLLKCTCKARALYIGLDILRWASFTESYIGIL